jgi:hypothetical protein
MTLTKWYSSSSLLAYVFLSTDTRTDVRTADGNLLAVGRYLVCFTPIIFGDSGYYSWSMTSGWISQLTSVCVHVLTFIWSACDFVIDLTVCILVLHNNSKVLHLRKDSVKKCVLILFSCVCVVCLALYLSKHTWSFTWKYWENHEETSVGVAGNSVEIPVITSRIQIRGVTDVRTNYIIRHHKLYLLNYWSFKTFLILSLSSSMLLLVNYTSYWEIVNSLNTSKGCSCHNVVIWFIFIWSRH